MEGKNALKLIGSVAVAVPADYTRHICEAATSIYMGKVREAVKRAHYNQNRFASHRLCRWLFVLQPSISAYPSARSDRKRGLAKLPLDDGPLRNCGIRPGRQLQHCRALAIAQARD
jgi:hypothetical protein